MCLVLILVVRMVGNMSNILNFPVQSGRQFGKSINDKQFLEIEKQQKAIEEQRKKIEELLRGTDE